MAFDGSGTYSRIHDWENDRDAAIKIMASRMDAEDDSIATAFNLCFLRDGRAAMTGTMAMGANKITGLASGVVGAPAIAFNSAATTGIYYTGTNFGVAHSGTLRLAVSAAGIEVTGTVISSGVFSAPDGAVGAPAYAFTNDLDCGLYRIGTNNIAIAVGGSKVVDLLTTGVAITGNASFTGTLACDGSATLGNSASDTHTINGIVTVVSTGVPLAINSTNSNNLKLTFSDNGTNRAHIGSNGADTVITANAAGTTMFTIGSSSVNFNNGQALQISSTQILTTRRTGWGAPTGTATRTTFDTASVTLPQLAERVKALIDDLTTHGVIGA